MSIIEKVKIVLYRVAEKGLEVFLVKSEEEEIQVRLVEISEHFLAELSLKTEGNARCIELDPIVLNDDLQTVRTIAIEEDWDGTPSIRAHLKGEYLLLKNKLSQAIPGFDSGVFVAFKDTLSRMVQSEYKAIKELKEVLSDRNTVQNI
jgi:hypothetical protein